jgi:UDP-N-acetylmuramyl pentapeptide phosphotransferase/UDP-N-acetylglucosamine-1-phosphate transferase
LFFLIILAVSGSTWLAIEVWDINLKKLKSERANIPQLIGMLISIICYIFRIQHWPFAGPMFLLSLIGLIFLAIGFIIDLKEVDKIAS